MRRSMSSTSCFPPREKITLGSKGSATTNSRQFVEFGSPFDRFCPTRASEWWGLRRRSRRGGRCARPSG